MTAKCTQKVADLLVGDPVVLCDYNDHTTLAQVMRVGRLNVYIGNEPGRDTPFCRTTGRAKNGFGNAYLKTVPQYEIDVASAAARKELQGFDVHVGYRRTQEEAVAIAEALKPLMASWSK